MKLPEKPADWKETLDKEGTSVFNLAGDTAGLEKISEYNRKYYYWSDLTYRVNDRAKQKYIWAFMKFLRSSKYEKIPFDQIDIKYAGLPEINRKLHQFDMYLAGRIEIQTKALGLEKRYIISSLMEEAIASSILEGAATTRKAAKEMLREKRKPVTKAEKMVVNCYETMRMIVARQNEKLTPQFLKDIQSAITKDTMENPKDSGNFRDNSDIIVADPQNPEVVYHVPPTHEKIPALINELCEFANSDDGDFIHPVLKGIVLHFLVGFIHPFNDGNGRTARSVFYWYVLSRGYWLFEYMAVSRRILRSRNDYALAYLYTEYDDLDLTYFMKYITGCIEDSQADLMTYVRQKQAEQKEAGRILEKLDDVNYRQASILEEMMKDPGKKHSIQEITQLYRVVYQTARTDLLSLAKKGYVKMEKEKRGKKFLFYCDETCREKTRA